MIPFFSDNIEDLSLNDAKIILADERAFLRNISADTARGEANMNAALRDHFNRNGIYAEKPEWYGGQASHLHAYKTCIKYLKKKIRRLEVRIAELTRNQN